MVMTQNSQNKRGLFVTFEGIDGCGKTTQLDRAHDHLISLGYTVTKLREPGSTPVSEKIRDILLSNDSSLTDTTELLLYEAARSEITEREIRPLLEAGQIVLCDRFYDSTTAYQGYGRQLDIAMIKQLHKVAVGEITPDLTMVFDVDLDTAFSRRGNEPDRLESQSRAFFERVRRGFLQIAAEESDRVRVIDALGSVDEIFADVKRLLAQRMGAK